jgi:integrase
MVLKMASPWKDPKTGIFYLRVRVPSELVMKVKGRTITLPVGDTSVQAKIGETVKVSLRTRDPRETKTRFATVLTTLNDYWEAIRKGPQKLSHKEAVALAGEIYRAFVQTFEEDPGSYERWANVLEANEQASVGGYGRGALMIGHQAKVKRSMEDRFGAMTDALVTSKGLVIDKESRERVLVEVGKALDQAASQLKRFADGDYSPDPRANRFPAFHKPSERQSHALTMTAMFEAWEKEAMQLNRASATPNRYRSVFTNFRGFLGHNDAMKVTAEDVIRFKDARLAEGISGKTIKDADLAALKSVFGWAVENKRLPMNPAADVTIRVARQKVERENGFTDEEAKTILQTALTYSKPRQESEGLAAAKRWVPWICAFSGARVSEVTALRKESFRTVKGVHVVRIMGTKNGAYRDVPLHPQLEEIGLLKFVDSASPGPLFYSEKDQSGRGAQSQSEKLAKWVRAIGIADERVQPNHGWRHRFTTKARAVGMDHEKREYILGHTLPGMGGVYGDMAGLCSEIKKLPWYDV